MTEPNIGSTSQADAAEFARAFRLTMERYDAFMRLPVADKFTSGHVTIYSLGKGPDHGTYREADDHLAGGGRGVPVHVRAHSYWTSTQGHGHSCGYGATCRYGAAVPLVRQLALQVRRAAAD